MNPNKAYGIDGLPVFAFKEFHDVLCKPNTLLFNIFLFTCIIPAEWKMANVALVFKNGKKNSIKNYRPVLLLCVISKVFEKCVYNNIFPILRTCINPDQHGFIDKWFTCTNLVEYYNTISECMDKWSQFDSIYLRLSPSIRLHSSWFTCP